MLPVSGAHKRALHDPFRSVNCTGRAATAIQEKELEESVAVVLPEGRK
jgi:hypothetical protein